MNEQWREVEGFPGYFVSDAGRVFGKRGKVLRPGVCSRGYSRVILMRDRKRVAQSVHRLVLRAFVGQAPDDAPYGAHLNGNPRDNRLRNLKWVSQSENLSHRAAHGTEIRGERNGRVRLTADKVRQIKAALANGASLSALAAKYGVNTGTVAHIKSGKNWRHVT
ncbi:HNH endonuclease [Streptomyces asiaticus]|uniref:HNH endonuclease n=1 Tax=Streptomyces asiaticus TaxID=114695 RepID=UPI001BA560E0|nr:HNH endonuclease [Streptomyces asiaticus]